MRILALEPYYGGSHQAFLDGWVRHSRHAWSKLTLPPHKWKWRMRHAAISFAKQVNHQIYSGQRWDLVFVSDMLDLATFLGLAHATLRSLPAVAYFHENQLTYPVLVANGRDHHFGFTNFTTTLAADAIWFNSQFHLDSFYVSLRALLNRMPDNQPREPLENAQHKSAVQYVGVESISPVSRNLNQPLRILWAARWEHDKNPESFFAAIEQLERQNINYSIDVIGETFRDVPSVFNRARIHLANRINRWGYQSVRAEYLNALAEADVFVSTAQHEFFGIAAVEAILAGAFPLLPRRLAYPELLSTPKSRRDDSYFYDGTTQHLAECLAHLADLKCNGTSLSDRAKSARNLVQRFTWEHRAPKLDEALSDIAEQKKLASQ